MHKNSHSRQRLQNRRKSLAHTIRHRVSRAGRNRELTLGRIQGILDACGAKSHLSGATTDLTLARVDLTRPFAVGNIILCTKEESRHRRRWGEEAVRMAQNAVVAAIERFGRA